jgi:hypothetical protein
MQQNAKAIIIFLKQICKKIIIGRPAGKIINILTRARYYLFGKHDFGTAPEYGINTADYTPYIHNIHSQGTTTLKKETIYTITISTKETL